MKSPQQLAIALTGLLSLAVAMGIGRFAFTPLLPMMLHDGVVTLPTASWLATANYLGYLAGALGCAAQPVLWRRLGWTTPPAPASARALPPEGAAHVPPGGTRTAPGAPVVAARVGLVATVVLTLGMATPWASAWPLWRFLAGVASALVFVHTSGWCLARLTALGAPSLAGLIYVGPGLGITVSGLAASAMVAAGWRAASGWLCFGVLAAALTAFLWPRLRGTVSLSAASSSAPPAGRRAAIAAFTLAYGLAGFGYIVTATFLPVIARQALPGSVWLDLFWPLFGLGVAFGALLTVRLPVQWDRRHLLMGSYAMQAVGILLSVWWPSLGGFAIGSLLLGLPFTAITLFAMQEARRLQAHNASAFIGLLTAAYGLGQIAGPPMVALLLAHSSSAAIGFERSLQIAAGALLLGLLIFGVLARRHPLPRDAH